LGLDQIKAIEAFVAVARCNSFSGAARQLQISNASVTRHINDLEGFLGVTLFVRTTRALSLTETGSAYLVNVKHVLPQLYAANDLAKGERITPQGLLRITAPILFGQLYVTPVIRQYLDKYSDVSVEATFLDRTVSMIDEGFDVAIRIGHLPDSNMRAAKICDVRWTVCASPEYWHKHGRAESVEALQSHNVIDYVNDTDKSQWHFANKKTLLLKPRLMLSSVTACIDSAIDGWGVVRALSYQVAPYIKQGKLVQVLSEYEDKAIPVHLLHNDHNMGSAKIRAFKDLMLDAVKSAEDLS
jgi:DNA-binding transcriptional LysR family regulator